jgi:cell division septal protein FtsQ
MNIQLEKENKDKALAHLNTLKQIAISLLNGIETILDRKQFTLEELERLYNIIYSLSDKEIEELESYIPDYSMDINICF